MKTISSQAELATLHSDESAIIRASGKYPDGGTFTNCYALPVPTDITDTEEHYWRVVVHGDTWLQSLVKEADILRPATLIYPLTFDAATPHLRASVAEEVRDFRDCYQHTYAISGDPYAEGYLTACKAIIALLEGGAE